RCLRRGVVCALGTVALRDRAVAAGQRWFCFQLRKSIMTDKQKRSRDRPEGASFNDWMNSRVARRETRTYAWNALKFQADYDPKYGRAQMRYIGTGGTGVSTDGNSIPAEHFTFSTMILPAGHEGPLH